MKLMMGMKQNVDEHLYLAPMYPPKLDEDGDDDGGDLVGDDDGGDDHDDRE